MNIKSISGAVCAALLGVSAGLPATALADDHRGHYRDRDHHGHHYERHHERHSKQHRRHWKKHRKHARERYRHHRRHDHYAYNNYYQDDDDDHEKLLIGLVVGGILGYALNESADRDEPDYYSRNSYSQNNHSTVQTYRHNDGTCLQEREYQTTVIVGGREVDAYGTACLQPDGSWKRSPARLDTF